MGTFEKERHRPLIKSSHHNGQEKLHRAPLPRRYAAFPDCLHGLADAWVHSPELVASSRRMSDESIFPVLEADTPARKVAEKVLRVRLGMVRERLPGAPWISNSL